MPLYEYYCASCGKSCEVLQKVSAAPVATCPNCGKDQLERQVSAPRFQLKGTGWYVTDFKNQGKKAPLTPTQEDKKSTTEPCKTPTEEKS